MYEMKPEYNIGINTFIKEIIENNQKDFLIYWNEHTDGLDVDLNQALGLIHY